MLHLIYVLKQANTHLKIFANMYRQEGTLNNIQIHILLIYYADLSYIMPTKFIETEIISETHNKTTIAQLSENNIDFMQKETLNHTTKTKKNFK